MPARPIPGLKMVCLKLAPADIESITAIDREATARTGRLGSRTRAVRWAIRELTARLFLERAQKAAVRAGDSGTAFSPVGPATVPPE